MPTGAKFPHLKLTYRGSFKPKFSSHHQENPEVIQIKNNPAAHADRIREILRHIREDDASARKQRQNAGLPQIPADHGFLLKLPEGVDVDAVTKALGVELVAETEEGLMLVSSEDIDYKRIKQIVSEFEVKKEKISYASSIVDIYDAPDDQRRLRNILEPQALALWPFKDEEIYVLDFGIQTAASTRMVEWPRIKRKKNESAEEFRTRKASERHRVWMTAEQEWIDNAENRVAELQPFVDHYGGEILSGIMIGDSKKNSSGVVFPDSVQVRLKLNGLGIRDIIKNFPHLFDVSFPPEFQFSPDESSYGDTPQRVTITPPDQAAPAVCVIDSGIQEEHHWLSPAIDRDSSRCFLPDFDDKDVADYVKPKGHGTRVAGAVLYPQSIPQAGSVQPVSWIQNARVLDSENSLPETMTPENYLHQVVEHFKKSSRNTKIFNHSINSKAPCQKLRMSAWASKLDQLSHENDVLFIQSAGNQSPTGLQSHLNAGRNPPYHHFEPSMRVSNPAQSLHALTVGSISASVYEDKDAKSFAVYEYHISGFSRAGYGEPWSVVKPDVVEVGGDFVYSKNQPFIVRAHPTVSVELLNSTLNGAVPAFSRDGAGTSFSAPKVSHIAAQLQAIFPQASPLLYRALIVQSAMWPNWAENGSYSQDEVLRMVGYGMPSIARATQNSETRITLITPEAKIIHSKQMHLYTVKIPEELRNPSLEASIRIDVTLAYTALPRRTRARRTGYLETWLDWESSKVGEEIEVFKTRMENGGSSAYPEFQWVLHKRDNWGDAQGTNRGRGSVQKDWAVFKAFDFPKEIGIAVRAHKGWNHREGDGIARYCLAVSFEAVDSEVPIYSLIESQIDIQTETVVEEEIEVQTNY